MHYAIYLPGKSGANTRHLDDAGLGALIVDYDRRPNFTDIVGPDGNSGVLVDWLPAGKRLDWQTLLWDQSGFDPVTNLTGAFWFGRESVDTPVAPSSIERSKGFAGVPMALEDGQVWLLPLVSELPHRLVMSSETGQFEKQIKTQWQAYYDQTNAVMQRLLQAAESQDGDRIAFEDVEEWMIATLAINYRVARPLFQWLHVFDDVLAYSMVMTLTDFSRFRAAFEAVAKKAQGPSTIAPV